MKGLPKILLKIYNKLYKAFGPRHWWPAESPFEVMVGAILTQNTSWKNVEGAIKNLKKEGALTPKRLGNMPIKRLARLIRPAGYYNIKAKRLKSFLKYLSRQYANDIRKMAELPTGELRGELLNVWGIGPETADSILLYALNKPIFVIDAYTARILSRHGLTCRAPKYDDLQALFMENLPKDTRLFNEYHALIVQLGKEICRPKPKCQVCPLKDFFNR